MMSVLKKVEAYGNDDGMIFGSARKKLAEFKNLNYPKKMLWTACTTMGVHTRRAIWFEVRKAYC